MLKDNRFVITRQFYTNKTNITASKKLTAMPEGVLFMETGTGK